MISKSIPHSPGGRMLVSSNEQPLTHVIFLVCLLFIILLLLSLVAYGALCCCMDIPAQQDETEEMDINLSLLLLLYLSS